MNEKTISALRNAEKNYIDYKKLETGSLKLPEHIAALHALFDSFIFSGVAVSQVTEAIIEMEEDTYLFEALVEPHLRVVDDVEMIARQYTPMFVKYIAQIAQGTESKIAVEKLFA